MAPMAAPAATVKVNSSTAYMATLLKRAISGCTAQGTRSGARGREGQQAAQHSVRTCKVHGRPVVYWLLPSPTL